MFPLAPLPGSTSENTGQTSPPLPAYPVDATGTESCPCPKRSTFDTLNLTGKIKGDSQAYEPGRIWLKVKSRNATDVVCAAVIGPMAQPRAVVVGLPMAGRLRIVGRSSPLPARAGRDLARYLHPPRGKHPWPAEISDRELDRFNKEGGTVRLTLVEPLVVEVSADVAWSGRAFRHSVRLLRARPELDPHDVQFPGHLGG